MSPSGHPFHLWIGRDARMTAVALCEIRMSGATHTHEWGSLTDLTPGQPMSAGAASNRRGTQLILIAVAAVSLYVLAAGAYRPIIFATAVVLAVLVSASSSRAKVAGSVSTPNLRKYPDIHRLLTTLEERESFHRLLISAERIGATLPALEGLLDPGEAGDLVAQSLWDGAKILARRQELRVVRHDLQQHATTNLPDVSRARQNLLSQQHQAEALWSDINQDFERLTLRLIATAEAGEAYIRERDLDDALQRTERMLAELSIDDSIPGSLASEQLSDETASVLNAYRELNDLYGGKY